MDKDEKISELLSWARVDIETARDVLNGVGWDLNAALEILGVDIPEQQIAQIPNPEPIPQEIRKSPSKPLNPPEEEKLVLFGTNEVFTEKRNEALKRKRWLIVILTEDRITRNPLTSTVLRDYMNCRFIGMVTSLKESDGQWFQYSYKVKDLPIYAILDPLTAELIQSAPLPSENELASQMRKFLFANTKYGWPVDYEMERDLDDLDESDSDSSDEPQENPMKEDEKEPEDKGELIRVMIQNTDGKRAKIEVGENESIRALYIKAAEACNADVNKISLAIAFPPQPLEDMKSKVGSYPLKGAMVRMNNK